MMGAGASEYPARRVGRIVFQAWTDDGDGRPKIDDGVNDTVAEPVAGRDLH